MAGAGGPPGLHGRDLGGLSVSACRSSPSSAMESFEGPARSLARC